MRGQVVMISGPPGAGKTSAAALLAGSTPFGVHLETDMFYRWIRSNFVGPHLPSAHAQNTAVMDVMTDAAAAYADAGYTAFVDGVIGPWFVDRIARRLAARGIAPHYLVLRPDRATALERVSARDETDDVSGAAIMFDQFADLGEFESHVVPSHGGPADVAAMCRASIARGATVVESEAWVDSRWRVSVKGALGWGGEFVVLRNDRGEWELPGGRLGDDDSSPEAALQREMREELGLEVAVGALLDTWVYEVEGHRVLILAYRCSAEKPNALTHSDEHRAVALMTADQLASEPFPAGYLSSIRVVAGGAGV